MLFLRRFKHTRILLEARSFEEVPSPTRIPFIGSTLSLIFNGSSEKLHKYIDGKHRELGSIFRQDLGPVSAVFVADPEEMPKVFAREGNFPVHTLPPAWIEYNRIYGCKRGLFFMDGQEWQRHRTVLNNLLLKGDLNWIGNACNEVSRKLVANLGNISEQDRITEVLYKWSLDTMVAVLLGAECYAKNAHDLEHKTEILASKVRLVFETTVALQLIPAHIASTLKLPQWRKFVASVNEALKLANSLLATLEEVEGQNGLLHRLQQQNVQQSDVNRIIVDLILAAGDTTAYAMQWILYSVGRASEVQKVLLSNPELARNVIREALRLYPIAPFLTRILPEDVVLCGYGIPKGTLIVLSIYTSGRDEETFRDALAFKPERWDRNSGEYKAIMQKASLPFAMGTRSCVGRRIAEAQLESALVEIVKSWQIEVAKEVEVVTRMVLVPAEPIRIKFSRRK